MQPTTKNPSKPYYILPSLLLISISCIKNDKNRSQVKHDVGDAIAELPDFLWVDTKVEELSELTNVSEETKIGSLIKTIADKYHEVFLQLHPERIGIPKPKIIIEDSDLTNANARVAMACTKITIPQLYDIDAEGDSALSYLNSTFDLNSDFFNALDDECIGVDLNADQLNQLLSLSNSEATAWASFEQGEKDDVILKFELNKIDESSNVTAALDARRLSKNNFYFYIQTNIILFTKGILKSLPQEQIISVLGHELAHYYKAHGIIGEYPSKNADYDFLYQLDKIVNPTEKPMPAKVEIRLSNGREISSFELQWLFGSRINLYPEIQNFDYHQYLINLTWKNQYLLGSCEAFENLLQCIKEEKLVQSDISTWQWMIQLEFIEEVRKKLNFTLDTTPATLGDLFESVMANNDLDELITEHNRYIDEVIETANNMRLGYYTKEQEADELGLDLAMRIGIKYNDVIKSYLNLIKLFDSSIFELPGVLTYEACEKEYQMGFQNFIPIGDYLDTHHSSCFRAYNIFREYNAHLAHYRTLEEKERSPLIANNTWQEAVKSLP